MFYLDDEVCIENDMNDFFYGTIVGILGSGLYDVMLDNGETHEFWEDELS